MRCRRTCHTVRTRLDDLARRYYAPLATFFRKRTHNAAEVQDLVQQVFLRLAQHRELGDIRNSEGYIFQTGQPEEAIRHYKRALELDDSLGGAHYGVAFLLLKRGDHQQAAEHLRAFLARPPKGPDAERWIRHAETALKEIGSSPTSEKL